MLIRKIIGLYLGLAGIITPALAQYDSEATAYKYLPEVSWHLSPLFNKQGINFPPQKIALVAIKDEKILELWAKDFAEYKYIKSYPILRSSGLLGPKLQQGDKQVPEGIYVLTSLNNKSQYHLSIKIDYPNDLDKFYAMYDKRNNLGGDIYIHGGLQSTGCLSMGNKAMEELFVLIAITGPGKSKIVITPTDFRKNHAKRPLFLNWVDNLAYLFENRNNNYAPKLRTYGKKPFWINDLYGHIAAALSQLKHELDIRPVPLKPYKRYKIIED